MTFSEQFPQLTRDMAKLCDALCHDMQQAMLSFVHHVKDCEACRPKLIEAGILPYLGAQQRETRIDALLRDIEASGQRITESINLLIVLLAAMKGGHRTRKASQAKLAERKDG